MAGDVGLGQSVLVGVDAVEGSDGRDVDLTADERHGSDRFDRLVVVAGVALGCIGLIVVGSVTDVARGGVGFGRFGLVDLLIGFGIGDIVVSPAATECQQGDDRDHRDEHGGRCDASPGPAAGCGRGRLGRRRRGSDDGLGRTQAGDECARALESLLGILGQRRGVEPVAILVAHRGDGIRRVGQQCRDEILAYEGRRSLQQEVRYAPEPVDVGSMVDVGALRLLGRHVLSRAERARRVVAELADRRSDAEVGEVDTISLEQDVGRLHVAVHEATIVGVLEGGGHRGQQVGDVVGAERTVVGGVLFEGGPFDQPHGEIHQPIGLARLVHRHDVGVVERGGGPPLTFEPSDGLGVAGHDRVEHLDGDITVQSQLGRPPHRTVSAFTQRFAKSEPSEGPACEIVHHVAKVSQADHGAAYDAHVASVPRVLTRRPRSAASVARPRLIADTTGRLTVLVGPVGSGKSVLAGQLADEADGRVVWVRLAPNWASPGLLPVLIGAAVGADTDETEDPSAAADLILEWLEDEPTCLVVDDLHEADGDVESVLAEVVSFLPPDSSLIVTARRRPAVLIGRSDPALLRVVDAEELAFDHAELSTLLDGRDGDATSALAATGGWASLAAAFAEHGADSDSADGLLADALSADALGDGAAVARTLAAVPYADAGFLASQGHDPSAVEALAERTSLVADTDGRWILHSTARDHLLSEADPVQVADIRRAAGLHIADEDAPTAVELLIEAGAAEQAGEVLARHASSIGATRATRWLYQLPAEVRRSLPPLLTDGRATVNVDLAIESARRQIDAADDPRSLREAHAGLGSLLLADAQLAEAADALESAMRLADDDAAFRALVGEQIATARWLAGDQVGAAAMLDDLDPTPWTGYLRTVLAADAGDVAAATAAAAQTADAEIGPDGTDAPALAAAAIAQTLAGDAAAAASAAAAYAAAATVAGRDLAVAGPVHAWHLIRAGDHEGAEAIADQLTRSVARHDTVARLHSAHLRLAIQQAGDEDDGGRAARRVADLAGLGLTPVGRLIEILRGDTSTTVDGLVVTLCGSFTVAVDGTELPSTAWKSKKARDVCALLSNAGELGLRREQVIEEIWEGRDPQKGRTLLRTALSEIRRVLEPRRGTGQESRFVAAAEDRVIVRGVTDLARAEASRIDDPVGAFLLVAPGPAADGPDAEWFDVLRSEIERIRTELATRVAADDTADPATRVSAYEALIEAEPWQRSHFQELADFHRARGDDHAAEDVDRRWFADD